MLETQVAQDLQVTPVMLVQQEMPEVLVTPVALVQMALQVTLVLLVLQVLEQVPVELAAQLRPLGLGNLELVVPLALQAQLVMLDLELPMQQRQTQVRLVALGLPAAQVIPAQPVTLELELVPGVPGQQAQQTGLGRLVLLEHLVILEQAVALELLLGLAVLEVVRRLTGQDKTVQLELVVTQAQPVLLARAILAVTLVARHRQIGQVV